jgi:transposase
VGGSVGDDRVVTRTGVISDEFWAVVEPVLPTAEGKRGRRWRDHREVLEAIAWRFRTGSPWRDLPEDLVPWQTAWKRHRRWSVDGTYAEIFAAVRRAHAIDTADLDAGVQKLLSVDSTSVRAHQHAAGARSDTLTGGGIE